jgi:hypothetical protein
MPASSRRVEWRSNTPETNFRLVKVDDFRLTASTIGATLIASSPVQAGMPLRALPHADNRSIVALEPRIGRQLDRQTS